MYEKKKPAQPKVDPAEDWKDIPGKPQFQRNGLGQLRTKDHVPGMVKKSAKANYMYGDI